MSLSHPRFVELAPGVRVSGQLSVEDIRAAAGQDIAVIVNNRPDHEEPGQPTSATIEAACRDAGIDYVFAPVRGLPGPDQVEAVRTALDRDEAAWLFCRSGMRSAAAWAMATALDGRLTRDEILASARAAGYDLGGLPF